jgi:hypothetical protein
MIVHYPLKRLGGSFETCCCPFKGFGGSFGRNGGSLASFEQYQIPKLKNVAGLTKTN